MAKTVVELRCAYDDARRLSEKSRSFARVVGLKAREQALREAELFDMLADLLLPHLRSGAQQDDEAVN